MTQDGSQSQTDQLADKVILTQLWVKFFQLAAVTQNQLTEPVQFRHGKTSQIGIVKNIGAVLVEVTVRNSGANFKELCRPS